MTNRTLEELENTYLSGSSVDEFDSLVAGARRKRIVCASMCGSLVAILILALYFSRPTSPVIDSLSIVEGIEKITELYYPDVLYIEARPDRDKVYLTAHLRDGVMHKYLMYIEKDGTTPMIANNFK